MRQTSKTFLPTLWSRLCGCDSQSLNRNDQIALVKAEILQNITLILNSRSHMPLEKMHDATDVQFSSLGFGLADFCGQNHNQARLAQLKQKILEQIRFFEPRLEPDSIQLTFLDRENELGPNSPNYVNLEIKARLKASLSSELFTCVSRLDLDSGNSAISLPDAAYGR